jgi:hypothetical protein
MIRACRQQLSCQLSSQLLAVGLLHVGSKERLVYMVDIRAYCKTHSGGKGACERGFWRMVRCNWFKTADRKKSQSTAARESQEIT